MSLFQLGPLVDGLQAQADRKKNRTIQRDFKHELSQLYLEKGGEREGLEKILEGKDRV